jgi:flavin-dependent dehydrogenase
MSSHSTLKLTNGSRVGVIGGGPAGSFFSYFLLQFAARLGLNLRLDIYESRDFAIPGPSGCNMCAGVISESLVQQLSIEGIALPDTVIQRGITSYVMHTEREATTIATPLDEMRIATVHRGSGPRGVQEIKWKSFDGYLLQLAQDKGANLIRGRVHDISWNNGRLQLTVKGKEPQVYDLLVGAVGVNSPSLSLFENLGMGYQRPKVRRLSLEEIGMDFARVSHELGTSMHVFLLKLPKVDFAALVPKGNYVTIVIIGTDIDHKVIDSFAHHPAVQRCLSESSAISSAACHCSPQASIGDAVRPFGDRVVLIGDCGVSRLNKDGIGSAYRTAKAAATAAIFEGVSAEDFRRHYWPVCRAISRDNRFGKVIFDTVNLMKRFPFLICGVMRMTRAEQLKKGKQRRMSLVLWDMFTGSAPYRDVFIRTLHPIFISRFTWHAAAALLLRAQAGDERERKVMKESKLGKLYKSGETIVRQGEKGDCMYVIVSGRAEVIQERDGKEIRLGVMTEGDVFGEMALFNQEVRSATVRALGEVRALTVDKEVFLRRVHEDPSFAFRILQKMSQRIRERDAELLRARMER